MKETPFTRHHIELGAKMTDFAGFNMPVEYSGINSEHLAVRNNAGLFDVSHMGEIMVTGKNALAFLQYTTANDVSVLEEGSIQYTYFPNENGGITDDLLIYKIEKERYLLVVNASNIEKDWNFLRSHAAEFGLAEGTYLVNISDETAQLALQGPRATEILNDMTGQDFSGLKYYTFTITDIGNIKNAIISATGYTGAGGYEIYVENRYAEELWEKIWKSGKKYDLAPVGLGARDTLRLEMGYCLYGNDISDETPPLEAGLGWVTKLIDGKDFIGKEKILDSKKKRTYTET